MSENNGETDLDDISQYKLDELESKAYKLSLIWLAQSRKIFPDYNHVGMKSGDPRKSLLFKYCYKLVRETLGVLTDNEYPLYIRSQLDVLKHIVKNSGNPVIDPACLTGDKAWKRWKLWKKRYDEKMAKPSETVQPIGPGVIKALDGLQTTKEFIVKSLGASPTIEKYQEAYLNNNLFRWTNFGKISPYYLAISPYISAIMKPEDLKRLNFDPDLYKPCITEEVIQKFKQIFPHENLK